MSRFVRRASLALLCLVTAGVLQTVQPPAVAVVPQAPADDPQPLFAEKPNRETGVRREPTTKRVRYVGADLSLLPAPGRGKPRRFLKLDLFDDAKHMAVLNETAEIAPGVVSWTGHLKGVPLSDANFIVHDGVLAGSVRMPSASYQIEWAAPDTYAIVDFDESQLPADHEHAHAPLSASDGSDTTSDAPVAAATDDGSVIDLLVVYTDDARAAAGGTSQIRSNTQLAVTNTNVAYANSNVTQRLNLVHQEEISYAETGDMARDLNRVTDPSDVYLDNVHTLRNTHNADLVALITDDREGCGIAWVMTDPSRWFAPYGFSVTSRACATGGLTLAHELGHNMGLMHDRYVAPDDGAYPYSHGFVDPSLPRSWRTIMAYNNLCVASGTNCGTVQYFSNPNLVRNGDPMGIAEGQPNSADSAKSLNNTASIVANFRDAPDPCADDALEPNDSTSAATAMSPGQTHAATLCAGNVDVFAVPASAGQTVDVQLDHDHAAGDLDMVLQDAAGNDLVASTSNDDDERIVHLIGLTGTYHVRVYGSGAATNTYALTLTVSDVAPALDPRVVVTKKGKGTVRSNEPTSLITCGADCAASYAPGSSVTLAARPRRGYRFAKWAAGPCAAFGRRPCTLTVDGSVAVKAVFRQI